jgi:hypothetical protein
MRRCLKPVIHLRHVDESIQASLGTRASIARAAALILLLLVPVAPAHASTAHPEPGVFVDPSSPAGSEYAIPLGNARGVGGSGRKGGLYGSGIATRSGGGGGGGGSGTGSTGGSGPPRAIGTATAGRPRGHIQSAAGTPTHPGAVPAARGGSSPPPRAANASARVRAVGSGGGAVGIVWMLVAAGVVVAVGLAGGQALARHGRDARAG